MATLTTDPFSYYSGVALTHEYSGPLLWSPAHRAWLRKRQLGTGWGTEPADGDKVDEEELEAALVLATEFPGFNARNRCGCKPRPQSHYIALDLFGKHRVYWPLTVPFFGGRASARRPPPGAANTPSIAMSPVTA